MSNKITMDFARRDDCLDMMVPSDLRVLIGEKAQLQQQVTELQARVARLEQACEIYDVELGNMGISCPESDAIANETPAQSLAAIQADAVDMVTAELKGLEYYRAAEVSEERANQLRAKQ